jgi:hypothetical protein
LCFVGSNFQEQGSLNAITKGIKNCCFHFLVYLVFVDYVLCKYLFWVRWWGYECISILLQWAKSYSRLGLNSPKISCVFVLCGLHLCQSIGILLILIGSFFCTCFMLP